MMKQKTKTKNKQKQQMLFQAFSQFLSYLSLMHGYTEKNNETITNNNNISPTQYQLQKKCIGRID